MSRTERTWCWRRGRHRRHSRVKQKSFWLWQSHPQQLSSAIHSNKHDVFQKNARQHDESGCRLFVKRTSVKLTCKHKTRTFLFVDSLFDLNISSSSLDEASRPANNPSALVFCGAETGAGFGFGFCCDVTAVNRSPSSSSSPRSGCFVDVTL